MTWLTPAILATLTGTVVLSVVYYYLYQQDRQLYLKIWTASWIVYTFRYIFQLWMIAITEHPILLIANQLAALSSGLLLMWGTHVFLGRKMPRWWGLAALLGGSWIILGVMVSFPFAVLTTPTFFFLGIVFIWTGLEILRSPDIAGLEKQFTGWTFVLWGVHKFENPFLLPVTWFAPWGFLIGAVFELNVALGFILIYFQKTRTALHASQVRYRRLVETARHFTESLEVRQVLERIGMGAKQVLEAYGCSIYLLEADGRTLRPVVALEPPIEAQILSTPLDIDASFTGQAVKAKRGLIFNNAVSDTTGTQIPGTPIEVDERVMVAPFIGENQVYGAICLNRIGRLFTNEDLELVETFAAYASTALKNAQAHDRLQREVLERVQAEEALRASEERFRLAFQTSPDAISINRLIDGRYVDINQGFCALSGYSREQVIGKSTLDLGIWADEKQMHAFLGDLSTNGVVDNLEAVFQLVDGNKRTGLISARVMTLNGESHVLSITRDIEERKKAEEVVRENEARLRQIIEQMPYPAEICAPDGTAVMVNQAYLDTFNVRSSLDVVGKYNLFKDPMIGGTPGLAEKVGRVVHGETVFIPEIILPGRTQDWNSKHQGNGNKIQEATMFPVLREKGDLWQVVTIWKDITERKQREREQEAIIDIGKALRSAQSRTGMFPVLLDQVGELLHADGITLALRAAHLKDLVVEHTAGHARYRIGDRISAEEGVVGRVIKSGTPFVTAEGLPDLHLIMPTGEGRPITLACVPLIASQEPIGVLLVFRQMPIEGADLRLLIAVSEMAASAIQRATLHEETRRRLQRLDALHKIDLAISASLDLNLTFNILLDQVTDHLEVEAANILRFNPRTQMLSFIAGRGKLPYPNMVHQRLEESCAGRAVLEQRVIHEQVLGMDSLTKARGSIESDETRIEYYAVPLIARNQVTGVLEIFHTGPVPNDPEWLDFLEAMALQAAIAIDNAELFNNLQRSNLELSLAYDTTLEGWSKALDLRDKETEGHTQRVTETTLRLGEALGLEAEALAHMRRGALLHDIGKMGIPDSILHKPGPLNEAEWTLMRRHPVYAYEMLSPIIHLRPALDIPYCHHEKWNGSGYPRGLKGEEIPLAARIFAVVDVWDALLSDRPYRIAWSEEKVSAYIRQQAGQHFDPVVVEEFLKLFSK